MDLVPIDQLNLSPCKTCGKIPQVIVTETKQHSIYPSPIDRDDWASIHLRRDTASYNIICKNCGKQVIIRRQDIPPNGDFSLTRAAHDWNTAFGTARNSLTVGEYVKKVVQENHTALHLFCIRWLKGFAIKNMTAVWILACTPSEILDSSTYTIVTQTGEHNGVKSICHEIIVSKPSKTDCKFGDWGIELPEGRIPSCNGIEGMVTSDAHE